MEEAEFCECGYQLDAEGYCPSCDEQGDEFEPDCDEPDLDFMFEHDSSMSSAGFGTDEDYGYYGDGDDY